jgi:hypothetical protein
MLVLNTTFDGFVNFKFTRKLCQLILGMVEELIDD